MLNDVRRGSAGSGKVFAITLNVCTPTPAAVMLERGKRKGLSPAWKDHRIGEDEEKG